MQKTKTKTGIAVALVAFSIISTVAAATIIIRRQGGSSVLNSAKQIVSKKVLPGEQNPNGPLPKPTTPTAAVCGDSKMEVDEECDDGNTINGDGCSASCQDEPQTTGGSSGPACMVNIAATEFGYTSNVNSAYGGSIQISKALPRWADASKNLHEEITISGLAPAGMSITGKSCEAFVNFEQGAKYGVTATLNGDVCVIDGKLPAGKSTTIHFGVDFNVPSCPMKTIPKVGQAHTPPEPGQRVYENGQYFCEYSDGSKDPARTVSSGAGMQSSIAFIDCQVEGFIPTVQHLDVPLTKVTILAPGEKRFYSLKVPSGVREMVIGQSSQDQVTVVNFAASMNPSKSGLETEYNKVHDSNLDLFNGCFQSAARQQLAELGYACQMGSGSDMNAYKASTGYWFDRGSVSGSGLTINDPEPGMYYFMMKNTSSDHGSRVFTRVKIYK